MGLKAGANSSDRVQIQKLHAAGKSIEEISFLLAIEKDCVKRFIEDPDGKKQAAAEKPAGKTAKGSTKAPAGNKAAKDEFESL